MTAGPAGVATVLAGIAIPSAGTKPHCALAKAPWTEALCSEGTRGWELQRRRFLEQQRGGFVIVSSVPGVLAGGGGRVSPAPPLPCQAQPLGDLFS